MRASIAYVNRTAYAALVSNYQPVDTPKSSRFRVSRSPVLRWLPLQRTYNDLSFPSFHITSVIRRTDGWLTGDQITHAVLLG
jgi:hypothetical protein